MTQGIILSYHTEGKLQSDKVFFLNTSIKNMIANAAQYFPSIKQ